MRNRAKFVCFDSKLQHHQAAADRAPVTGGCLRIAEWEDTIATAADWTAPIGPQTLEGGRERGYASEGDPVFDSPSSESYDLMTCLRALLALPIVGLALTLGGLAGRAETGAGAAPGPAPVTTGAIPVPRKPLQNAVPSVRPNPAMQKAPGNQNAGAASLATRTLANLTTLHIELLPLQGDVEKCGLDHQSLQTAAIYPIAASARLRIGDGTLTHAHLRLTAVYVPRIDHCMLHADMRVSSLQEVELKHAKTTAPLYIPLWEKMDIRLAPRQLAQRTAQDRLRQLSEKLLIDWAGQN